MKASEEAVGYCGALMRHKIEWVTHQVAIEHRDGGLPGTLHQMGESGEMGLLALVQCQGSDGFDQCLGLSQQPRVIGQRKHPGFAQICHREFGGALACSIKQPNGVATDEVEGPHRLIVGGAGFSRRACEMMPLRVLDHGWLNSWRSRSSSCPGRRYRPIGSCRSPRRADPASAPARRNLRDGP